MYNELARLVEALDALTGAEGQIDCIPPGPERDELQAAYEAAKQQL